MKMFTKDGHLRVPGVGSLPYTTQTIAADPKHLVRQVYCQNGHPLIGAENILFDGYPGIELYCESDRAFDIVTLSPYLGDRKKNCEVAFEPGEILRLCCPSCMNELPIHAPHDCREGAQYIALFLTEEANMSEAVGICSAWGCHSATLQPYGEIITRVRYDSVIPKC